MMVERASMTDFLQRMGLALFAVTLFISITAVNLRIGPVPIRSFVLLAAGFCVFAADPSLVRAAARLNRPLTGIIGFMAVLGVAVSMIAGTRVSGTAEQIVEIHAQAFIGSMIASGLMIRFGVNAVLLCFVAAFAFTVLVAIAQAFNIDLAWQIRVEMGRLMNDPPEPKYTYMTRYRVLGMSFSPIHFGTQSCLVLVSVMCMRAGQRLSAPFRYDWLVVAAVIVLAALSVLTGNRSALLGFILFSAVYMTVVTPRLVVSSLPILFILALAAVPLLRILSDAGVRAVNTENSSAAGRATLRAFGWFLIGQRPLGYGLTFNSLDHWTYFTHQAGYLDNPIIIRLYALHNCYLNLLAKYGVLVLATIPMILPRNRLHAFFWLAFLPYIVHIFYHNDGPFQGDFLFFYIVPAILMVTRRWRETTALAKQNVCKRPWRRAFVPIEAVR